jgi:hypothetical protein
MGDFRDQLKKIKNSLGLGGAEKKSAAPERPLVQKTIDVTVKKNRTGSLPPTVPKPVHETKKVQTPKRPPQTFQKKAQTTGSKTSTGARPLQKSDQSYVSPSGVTITRTIAPGAMSKPAPVSIAVATTTAPSALSSSTAQAGQLTLPSFTALTRKSEFKTPDAWVARGASSQLGSQLNGRRRDIFIGLDFGTAFTKAAVQILDNIYPIDWGGLANLKDKHLLPTEYSETTNGQCYLGQHPNAGPKEFHANLKRAFITQRVSDVSLSKAIVFNALVLQYIRAWVYKNHETKLGSSSIGWYLNIGIPSDVLDKDAHVEKYKTLADHAWTLSLRPHREITIANAFQALSNPSQKHDDLYDVSPIPELVAQLAGYSKSSSRQNGLHALVDIGGGTVDMVTFNVHQKDGDDNFPFFVSSVQPLGSYALLENRFLNLSAQTAPLPTDLQDLLSPEGFAKYSGVSATSIQGVDDKFFRRFQQEFESVLSVTHRSRYQSSPHWQSGIRTFISGGGSFVPGYVKSILTSRRPLKCDLHQMALPPHPKLIGGDIDLRQYSRISVACGLAEDAFSMGKIVPASAVPDGTALITTVNGLPPRQRPDRDELYPK